MIENGELDTNGNTFTLNGGTVIFTGPTISGLSPTHAPTGGGTFAVTAPTTGTWSGIALYDDPALTSGVDISAAGNSPTWDIVGMNYLPNANLTISGAVGKDDSGACQGFVVNTMTINGTGYIIDNNGCSASGLTLPNYAGGRVALVRMDAGPPNPRRPTRAWRRETTGIAAVEFALVASFLVVGMLNVVDVARYAYLRMQWRTPPRSAPRRPGARATPPPNCPPPTAPTAPHSRAR